MIYMSSSVWGKPQQISSGGGVETYGLNPRTDVKRTRDSKAIY